MTRRPPRATRTDTLFPYTPRFRSPWGLIKRVYLPAVMPEHITGAQLAFGNAWRALISAEMLIGFGKGLGRSLAYSRSEEHTSELQSLMRISYAVICLKKKRPLAATYSHRQNTL